MKSPALEEAPLTHVTTPLRVLLVEHSPHDIELILFELRDSGFCVEPTLAETRDEFRRVLANGFLDAVLADYRLPGWSGLDAFADLRAAGRDIPFLLVTGTLGEEAAVDCIKQGISDYILKDRLKRLPLALNRALSEKALRDENQRAHEALRISETRNRSLVEHAVYGIARVSSDGAFLDANPALRRMLGCASEEENVATLNLARDLFRFPEQYARLMAACREFGQIHGAEAEWKRRDGGILAMRLHLRRLSSDEESDTFEVIAEDVTELRALERQLRQAQKFEAIGQLAGGVAHDFTNVIGAILGWAEMGLEHSRDNPETTERFERIREQADRAAALTRELLAFARRQVLQPRAVDLNTVVNGLHSLLDKVIDKNIEVKFSTKPLGPVKADPTQLEQVLMNLCINARDAMPQGGRLVIETEMVESRRAVLPLLPLRDARALRGAFRLRYGLGNESRDARANFRTVFHDERTRQRYWDGTRHRLRHREATRWIHPRVHGTVAWQFVSRLCPRHGRRRHARRGGEIDRAVPSGNARQRNNLAR
jgi:two-component system, cell cycle sensor histidine kinase and response regulator CckA